MNNLKEYISEKLVINKDTKITKDLDEVDIDQDIKDIIKDSIYKSGPSVLKGVKCSKNGNKLSVTFDDKYSNKQLLWIFNAIAKQLKDKNISYKKLEFNRDRNQINFLLSK